MRKFKLHWQSGETQTVEGWDLDDAVRRAGIGNGALFVLDYWEEVGAERVNNVTLNYSVVHGGRIKVGIHPDHYGRTLSLVHVLYEKLTGAIPFSFTVDSGPEIRILGGGCVKRIMSVEMTINPGAFTDIAVRQLEENGFFRGFEWALD